MGIFDNLPGTPPAPQPQQPAAPQTPPGAYPTAAQGYAPPQWAQGAPQAPPPQAGGFFGQGVPQALPPGGYRPQSAFDGPIENEQTFGDNVPFWTEQDDGVHVVVLGRVKRFMARKGPTDTYSVECRILASSNPRLTAGVGRCKQEQATKEGAFGRIKKFIAAAAGVTPEQVDSQSYHQSYDEQRAPFVGTILAVETSGGRSKANRPFTNCAWRTLSDEEVRRYAAVAQQVDPAWKPAPLQRRIFGQ